MVVEKILEFRYELALDRTTRLGLASDATGSREYVCDYRGIPQNVGGRPVGHSTVRGRLEAFGGSCYLAR